MNAVVEISGKQFKVSKDSKLYVHRLDAKEGSKVSFENVLLLVDCIRTAFICCDKLKKSPY